MIRKSLLLLCALTLTTGLSAQRVSMQEARTKAMQFIGQKQGHTRAVSDTQLHEVNSGTKNVFAFNVGDNEGFVLVSGDERTLPILGYSDHGSFDLTKAPENLRNWMKGYEADIEALESTVKVAATRATAEPYGPTVEPLLKSQWNQDEPYNLLTPPKWGALTVTGCICTAVAQVMNYWKFPTHAIASMPGYETTSIGVDVSPLDYTFFDWQNMCDTYNEADNRTEEQNLAVAKLMRYVGQSMRLDYGLSATGGFLGDAVSPLKENFSYAESVTYLSRYDYSTNDWESLLYNELAAGRPVLYACSSDQGHAIVCDGYDKDRYFHFNWGWGGLADGNYLLSALNPGTNEGIGSASSSLGYSKSHKMIIGIEPADHVVGELPSLKMYFSEEFHAESKTLTSDVENAASRNGVFEAALVAMGEDGELSPIDGTGWFVMDTIKAKYLDIKTNDLPTVTFTLDLSDKLAPGEYLLYPMTRCISVQGDTWHTLLPMGRGVLYTVTAESTAYKLYPDHGLQVEDVVYKNLGAFIPHEVKFALSNHGLLDYNDEVTLTLRYADPDNQYESISRQVLRVGAYIDVNATDTIIYNFIPPRGGECAYELSTPDNVPFASGTMYFDDPTDEMLNALSIRDYEIQLEIDKYVGYNMIFFNGIAKNASPASLMGSLVFDLTIPGIDDQVQCEMRLNLPPNFDNPFSTNKIFVIKSLPLDIAIDFVLHYQFSPFYPPMPLLSGTLLGGKILTPDGYKDTPNGITELHTPADNAPRIIDLMGNEVRNADDARGVYIVNGKRVIRR